MFCDDKAIVYFLTIAEGYECCQIELIKRLLNFFKEIFLIRLT